MPTIEITLRGGTTLHCPANRKAAVMAALDLCWVDSEDLDDDEDFDDLDDTADEPLAANHDARLDPVVGLRFVDTTPSAATAL